MYVQPVQNSSSRAELHRKSIAQMKVTLFWNSMCTNIYWKQLMILEILQINTRSVQDMHIYADPSRVPVVLIEQHLMVVPQHGSSKDFATNSSEQKDTIVLPKLQGESSGLKITSAKKGGRVLRAVIFVHGFQASPVHLV
jgi:hypothetical protein